MEDFKKKRIRSPNFSNDEKILILNLVDKYRDILECKRTDGTTCRDKKSTWLKVAREFNSNIYCSEKRTVENIKTCYENLKKSTKKMAITKMKPSNNNGCSCIEKCDTIFDLTMSILNKTVFQIRNNSNEEGRSEEEIKSKVRDMIEDNNNERIESEDKTEVKYEVEHQLMEDLDDDFNEIEERYSQRSESERLSLTLNQQNEELLVMKAEVYRQQLMMLKSEEEYKEKQRQRDEIEFEIEKRRRERKWELEQRSLLLDIKIKEAQLKNINLNLNVI